MYINICIYIYIFNYSFMPRVPIAQNIFDCGPRKKRNRKKAFRHVPKALWLYTLLWWL